MYVVQVNGREITSKVKGGNQANGNPTAEKRLRTGVSRVKQLKLHPVQRAHRL